MNSALVVELALCALLALTLSGLYLWRRRRVSRERHPLLTRSLRILLSNGRFPVTIDIARQLHRAGHRVFVADPMEYHICKFTNAVKKSYYVPAPHYHPEGYINAVHNAVVEQNIDLIVPLHEEILYLAGCGDQTIVQRLFAPEFRQLVKLHSKWKLNQMLAKAGLEHPSTRLCQAAADLSSLDLSKELAVKPEFGRATAGVHHHKPGDSLPNDILDNIRKGQRYIAQEWVQGRAYCSYAVARNGRLTAFVVYPVEETLDGSSCVYFKTVEHDRIHEYCATFARHINLTGQFALDFIEEAPSAEGGSGRLVAIECNPRATSGVHLFSGETALAEALTASGMQTNTIALATPGTRRQVAPGMLMWDRAGGRPTLRRWLQHMGRLMGTLDVVFSWRDLLPTLTQPFFLTSYYEIARERKMTIGRTGAPASFFSAQTPTEHAYAMARMTTLTAWPCTSRSLKLHEETMEGRQL